VDNELEVIRDQMELKRASLASKLDALEDQVLDTVHEVTNTVSSTVKDVTDTVGTVTDDIKESVQAVKESLNVSEKVRQYPWIALGGAFATGFVGGLMLGPSSSKREPTGESSSRHDTNGKSAANGAAFAQTPAKASGESAPSSGLTSHLGAAAAEALETVKSMAVGTLLGVLSEVVNDALPQSLKEEADKLFVDLNSRLGGKELHKLHLFSDSSNPNDSSKGERYDDGDQTEMAGPLGSAPWQGQEPMGQPDRRRADASSGRLRANDRSARRTNG
jgi:ElaB/YqjD/DUF883 family membrane-anchored ribosome-binding protein